MCHPSNGNVGVGFWRNRDHSRPHRAVASCTHRAARRSDGCPHRGGTSRRLAHLSDDPARASRRRRLRHEPDRCRVDRQRLRVRLRSREPGVPDPFRPRRPPRRDGVRSGGRRRHWRAGGAGAEPSDPGRGPCGPGIRGPRAASGRAGLPAARGAGQDPADRDRRTVQLLSAGGDRRTGVGTVGAATPRVALGPLGDGAAAPRRGPSGRPAPGNGSSRRARVLRRGHWHARRHGAAPTDPHRLHRGVDHPAHVRRYVRRAAGLQR